MPAVLVTQQELRTNLGIGTLYSDATVEEVCQTSEDLINQYLWFNTAPVVGTALQDNVANTEISYKSGWSQMHKGWELIHDILWKTDLDTDVRDTRLTIKTGNQSASYWITAEDFEKIQQGAGDQIEVSIKIGQQITNETNNAAIWFNKLKHNELVKNPNYMIQLLNSTKNKFFDGILGLIAYDVNNPGIPIVTTSSDWAIIGLSQGMWVFGLKSVYPKYEFIQQQT